MNDIKSKNFRPRCLNCELDFFFKKRFRNEKKETEESYRNAFPIEGILYLYVQINTGYNAMVYSVSYYFSALKIN